MSGICGWLGAAGAHHDAQLAAQTLERMAAPLRRFDDSALHCIAGDGSAAAVAVAAGSDGVHVYRDGRLLIALWGRALLDGSSDDLGARLAQLWRQRGLQACVALSGPFALCILDQLGSEALLAIDRSGTHGLSYRHGADGLFFASSADALIAHPAVDRELDAQGLFNYLYFHMIPAPGAIYRGQQRLLPGEYLHVRPGRALRGSYWQSDYHEDGQASFAALKAEFVETLDGAVRASLGQASVGAFLSGGTDSSTLAGVLGRVSGRPARTYSIGFEAPGYDEMAYARLASAHFGTEHHELYVGPAEVVAAVPQMAALFDQPFGNASAVPAFYCAQMARADGVTRLLGGDGGDELFGGNERYARQALFARYERVPSFLRQIVIEPLLFGLAGAARHRLLCKARSYIEQASVALPGRLETYNLLQHYGCAAVLDPAFLARIDAAQPLGSLNAVYRRGRAASQINKMLALDMKFTLADNDLPKVVKACELAGVEVAFPFLSDAMVAFAARLRPDQKLNGTRLRYFFKQALADMLPRAILRKSKHGFGLPFGLWLQTHTDLRALAFDSLSDLKARRIVAPAFIDDLLARQLALHPAYHGTMVWLLMMLEQWHRQRQR